MFIEVKFNTKTKFFPKMICLLEWCSNCKKMFVQLLIVLTFSGSQVALEPETIVRHQVVLEVLIAAVQGAAPEGTVALVEVRIYVYSILL